MPLWIAVWLPRIIGSQSLNMIFCMSADTTDRVFCQTISSVIQGAWKEHIHFVEGGQVKAKINKHNTAVRSRHKSYVIIQYLWPNFPTQCPKWIFIIYIVLDEKKKKHPKLIYHIPWFGYIDNRKSAFIGPKKFDRTFWKITPPLYSHRNRWKKMAKMIGRIYIY